MSKTICYLCPKGNLTSKAQEEVFKNLKKEVKETTADGVSLDLKKVGFIDSSGLSFIIRLSKMCLEKKILFSIIHPSPEHARLFKAVNLDRIIIIIE